MDQLPEFIEIALPHHLQTLANHKELISLLQKKIQSLSEALVIMEEQISFYEETVGKLADLLSVSKENKKAIELAQIVPKELKRILLKVEQDSKSAGAPILKEVPVFVEKHIEVPVYIDRVVEVEKIVEKPVYIEKIIEHPIYIEKIVEAPVYINRTVEMPIYIDRTIEKPCSYCKRDYIQPQDMAV